MAKIELDKYYTSDEIAKYCVEKTNEIIGQGNIIEYIEPSAGGGVFLKYLNKPFVAYDVVPEGENIVQQDFLNLNEEYKEGRCIIGNPPYGSHNTLATRFYKKSTLLGDYISFILPISQLNNNYELFDFDLIYSEDLGVKLYSNREVHCCLNIYKRPSSKKLNKKPKFKLNDVEIRDYRRNRDSTHVKTRKENFNYDIRICIFGSSIGKEVQFEGQYVKESCIKINNDMFKSKLINIIKNANWCDIYNMTKSPNLSNWMIYKYIKEQMPELN